MSRPEEHPTSPPKLRVLAIDDNLANLEFIVEALRAPELEVRTEQDPEVGIKRYVEDPFDVVLVDLMMPKLNGIEVLEKLIGVDPGAEVILMTAHYSSESAVEAIKKGASDYLTKPLNIDRLRERLDSLVDEAATRRRARELESETLNTFQFQNIIGKSPLMLDTFGKVRRISSHFRTVLVTGESGTGKELIAKALHNLGLGKNAPYAVCNCSAIVDTLFESELFGYTKGAFTGATQDKVGLFESANGGTVFLDEIGELPLAAQAKLLRVLQNQEIQRVGSPAVRKINVRVVAATNRNLRAMVALKTFREDLFYRLATVEVALPRLADRKEDLPLLFRYFIEKWSKEYGKEISGLTRRAQALLTRYPWPGNVRELENILSSGCMMTLTHVIDIPDLPEIFQRGLPEAADDELLSMDEAQRRHVSRVLERLGGNKVRAAEVLGISRSTLYSLLGKAASTD